MILSPTSLLLLRCLSQLFWLHTSELLWGLPAVSFHSPIFGVLLKQFHLFLWFPFSLRSHPSYIYDRSYPSQELQNSYLPKWVSDSHSVRVWLFVTPWTIACQDPLSLEFSRQKYWSGLPFSSPGDLPNPGIKHGSPALQADSLSSEPPGNSLQCHPWAFQNEYSVQFSLVTQLCPTLCNPMDCNTPGFLPCPLPTPRACSNSCPSSRWCHPTISSSVVPFSSCLQSFPASRSFPRSQFFTSGGQSIGDSASASVLPINIQDWFPLRLTGLISLQSKKLSRDFSNTTVQKHQFFGTQLSLWSNSHIHHDYWKTTALTRWTFVGK